MTRRAADLLIDCLSAHDVDRIFCVPGESYLAALDALFERNTIQTVICRHEGGAGFAALADAKLTRRPGVAFVSRGPGATNASIAVHVAEQDATPLVLFIGQVARHEAGRKAFQEVDYAKTFSDMAKAVWTINDADRLPDIVAKAFQVAAAATPGACVVVLPEDMLEDMTASAVMGPAQSPQVGVGDDAQLSVIAKMLDDAKRPLIIAGGALNAPEGRAALQAACNTHQVPCALTFKRQDLFDNTSALYAGHLGFKVPRPLVDRLNEADLILAVGTRLGEVSTQGYTFPRAPEPDQPLIHIYDDAAPLNREYRTRLSLVADPTAVMAALAQRTAGQHPGDRAAWIERLHAPMKASRAWSARPDGRLDMGPVVAALTSTARDDAIFITDAGNFSGWLHRYFPFNGRHRLLGTVGGAMGLGMPAAVAAGLRCPGTQVITFIGDGGMGMSGAELATAVQYDVPVKVFISNNASYGTIRMHQENAFKGRVVGTALKNPDYAALAEAHGARGFTLATIDEAESVVAAALAQDGPVVVDVKTDVHLISPNATLDDLG
ncbi:MAG: thiamine pyrophosphate-dependent enzyme [Pseudomonadota bacterium]